MAVETEAAPLLAALEPSGAEQAGWVWLHPGRLQGREVVLARSLVGQVSGAMAAQALVVRYRVGCLIACGSAGAVVPDLHVGDVVIASRVVAHDAGFFVGDRFLPVGTMVRDARGRRAYRRAFEADSALVAAAHKVASALYGRSRVWVGTLASGNQAVFAPARKDWLQASYGALAVEMESAAVAMVAEAYGLPWVSVRCVSDRASLSTGFDVRPLLRYVDEPRPTWWQALAGFWYLLRRPVLWREARRLERGLRLAAGRAAGVVAGMAGRV